MNEKDYRPTCDACHQRYGSSTPGLDGLCPVCAGNARFRALGVLRPFIGKAQFACIVAGCRGEEKGYFNGLILELAKQVEECPKTYAQGGLGENAVVHLHYFKGGCDWWITEKDVEPEQHQAFGLVGLHGVEPELAYISIVELLENGVELDFHWTKKTLAEVKKGLN